MCAVARGKKWKNDCVTKEAIPVEKLVNIQIPPTLKKQLVDDCEFITHLGQGKISTISTHIYRSLVPPKD
ncbi:hypothetical protein CK203_092366 [Vitis vinifera]|uniref:Uncharacterized protein n=1 Tax=Vitis vinifera TaxID=29760 RepID=A0A438DYD8_VITVI|nr:hypothetical protein CK203_092366 [Vitis vinifera]